MHIKNRIKSILDLISAIAINSDNLAGLAEITTNAIKASSERAALQEPRLSTAARLSVCSAAMRFASVASEKSDAEANLRQLFSQVIALAPMLNPDHSADEEYDSPEGYSGPSKGPFVRKIDKTQFVIVRKPHLPGGNWTLTIDGVPSVYGNSPQSVSEKAAKLEYLFEPLIEMHP